MVAILRIRKFAGDEPAEGEDEKPNRGGGVRHAHGEAVRAVEGLGEDALPAFVGDGEDEEGEAGADEAAADVGGKTFAGAAQVHGEIARQHVAPKCELPDDEQSGNEDADVRGGKAVGDEEAEDEGHQDYSGQLKGAQDGSARGVF